jgi:hypothetical protein
VQYFDYQNTELFVTVSSYSASWECPKYVCHKKLVMVNFLLVNIILGKFTKITVLLL